MSTNTTRSTKPKKKQVQLTDNLLESLRDIGSGGLDTIKNEAGQIPSDFFNQMFGLEKPKPKASGDIMPGQSVEFSRAFEEQKQENQVLRSKLAHEQSLRAQEQSLTQQRGHEVRQELQTLVQEVSALAKSTQGLAIQTEIASQQAPTNPGIYHVAFFEKLRNYISSFRKRIENASLWMQAANQRSAKKKGFWGQVNQGGAKRLLSNEDYIQRSAG